MRWKNNCNAGTLKPTNVQWMLCSELMTTVFITRETGNIFERRAAVSTLENTENDSKTINETPGVRFGRCLCNHVV